MNNMRRMLAMLLAIVMILGLVPASVLAIESTATGEFTGKAIDAAIIMSDLHTTTSDNKSTLVQGVLNKIEDGVKNAGTTVSTVNSAGDMFSVNSSSYATNISTISSSIQAALPGVQENYVWSDHDRTAADISKESRFVYGAGNDGVYGTADDDNYYVYLLSMGDLSTNDRYNAGFGSNRANNGFTATVAQAIASFEADAAKLCKDRPLLIVSHQPLLDNRNDNGHAYDWCTAINTVATEMDVAFFFGHNHKYDVASDYYYAKGSTMSVCSDSSGNAKSVKLNFSHICAGYMAPESTNSYSPTGTRLGTALAVTIYENAIQFTTYNKNGVYTGNFALDVTIARDHASTDIPKSLAVTGKTDYVIGDSIVAPSAVEVTYQKADKTTYTEKITSGYTLSKITKDGQTYSVNGFTFAEEGNYTLTYTCTIGGYQAQAELYVTAEEAEAVPTVKTVYTHDDVYENYVEATGLGLTGITATYSYAAHAQLMRATFDNGTGFAYDITLEGHTEGDEIEYRFALDISVPTQNLALYFVEANGTTTPIAFDLVEDDSILLVRFKTDKVGTFIYGTANVPEGYTYTDLVLNFAGKTNYFVGDSFELYLAQLTAIYTNAAGKTFKRQLSLQDGEYIVDGYTWSGINMTAAGKKTVTFTYTDDGVTCTETVEIGIWNKSFSAGDVTVDIGEGEFGIKEVTATTSVNQNVAGAVSAVIAGTNYVAYDISMGFEEGYAANTAEKTVTMPIPTGVTNPVVYYVSDDGKTVTNMWAKNNGDGTVTFKTTHFSTYVVGQQAEAVFVDATVPGNQTTTYTATPITVYKRVNTPVAGNSYLIVSSSTGSGYGLDGDTTGYSTTAFNGGNGYYSSWNSTTNTGTAFNKGSDVYLETSGAYLWTVGSGLTFTHENSYGSDTYLGVSSNKLSFRTSSNWNYSNNRLRQGNNGRYLYCSRGVWSASNSSANVYFYEPVTIYQVTETTTGNPTATHHMDITVDGTAGTKLEANNVLSGDTKDLGVKFTSTPNGYAINATNATNWQISNNTIATIDRYGTLTFTGAEGSAVVTATYTWTENGKSYTVSNQLFVHTTAMSYSMNIMEIEQTVKIETNFNPTVQYLNAEGATVAAQNVKWTSSDPNVASVDPATGVITGVSVGKATITAEWTDPAGVKHTDSLEVEVPEVQYTLQLHVNNNGTPGAEITAPIALKNVRPGGTFSVWAVIKADDRDIGDVDDDLLIWTISDPTIATIDLHTGVITFTGDRYGIIDVTVEYTGIEGHPLVDTIRISVTDSQFVVPGDGTNDFPEYPAEGSVRHDKTSTAVGNFSETGIAKVELSLSGVPFSTGSEMDVVLMLDHSNSMTEARMEATREAVKVFIKNIVTNEDGTYNGNRLYIGSFAGGNPDYAGQSRHEFRIYQMTQNEQDGYQIINNKEELDQLIANVESTYVKFSSTTAPYGTEYAQSLQKCYEVLSASDDDNHQQFCVFMSDGIPNVYQYGAGENDKTTSSSAMAQMFTPTSGTRYTSRGSSYHYEYWSSLMKENGVTVFTVGLGLLGTNSSLSGASAAECERVSNFLLNDISGPAGETAAKRDTGSTVSKKDSYFFSVADSNAAADMENVFSNISKKILAAATDVTVEDKIGENYTMIFDAPNAAVDAADEGQDYFIEVMDYPLVAVKDANGNITDYTRGTGKSMLKLYFAYGENGYYAATNNTGTAAPTPTFAKVAMGEKGTKFYWTTNAALADANPIAITSDGVTYYFNSRGMSNKEEGFNADVWFNMTSGAFASGTTTTKQLYTLVQIDSFAEGTTYYTKNADGTYSVATSYVAGTKYYTHSESSTCDNMIIASPYFVYNAATKSLVWTIEKISASELTLTYFLYLNNSGGFSGTEDEITPDTYTTNQFAYVDYTNFQGNECQLEFPVPQMTWNGAQVSYVFYLVNEKGQPVNREGRVVPFSEAVYVTDIYTYAIIWNDLEQAAGLDANYLAINLVPDVYDLYDDDAAYNIHVYEDVNQSNLNNHFVIEGDVSDSSTRTNPNTTIVFNTKADGTKYVINGAYVADNGNNSAGEANLTYKCKDYSVTGLSYTVETKVDPLYGEYKIYTVVDQNGDAANYNGTNDQWEPAAGESTTGGTKIGNHVYYVDEAGQIYTIVEMHNGKEVYKGFDFANTTVAFAVVWKAQLVEDTVVVDFGLDVIIDVITNDNMVPGVVGVLGTAPNGVTMNTQAYDDAGKATTADVMLDGKKIGTATVANKNAVRFTFDKTNGMQLSEPIVFYYEANVKFYEDGEYRDTYKYSKVTIIPATTVYYEDEYVNLTTETKGDSGWTTDENSGWTTAGTTNSKVQATDRPGADKISAAYDADNAYGYDSAYSKMSMYSLGSAAKVNVKMNKRGVATFDFYGTGFDIISLTSNTTGTITVKVEDANGNVESTLIVDTYYGYAYGRCKIDYLYTETGWQIQKITTVDDSVADSGAESWPAGPTAGVTTHSVVGNTWYPISGSDNALYQVPIMKVRNLTYGKHKVTVTAAYSAMFDHDQTCTCGVEGCTGCYNFYLDAIRIYDPTGVVSGETNDIVSGAYNADGEGWPTYTELRDMVISAETFDSLNNSGDTISGVVFIDGATYDSDGVSISDYTNYGPNNELYLANGQAIAALLQAPAAAGKELASIQLGIKTVGDKGSVKVYGVDANGNETVALNAIFETATDMYYDITKLNGKTLVIANTGSSSAMISLTNIKVTYKLTEDAVAQVNDDLEVASFTLRSPARSMASPSAASETETTNEVTTEESLLTVNTEVASYALMSLRAAPEVEDDVIEDNTNTDVEEKPVEPETPEENEKPGKHEKPEKPGKTEKPEKPEKHEKPEKPEKHEKPEKPEKHEKPGKHEKPEKPEKPEKSGKNGNNKGNSKTELWFAQRSLMR